MGDILLDGHIGEFRNDNLESQEPAVNYITRGMAYDWLICFPSALRSFEVVCLSDPARSTISSGTIALLDRAYR